MNLNKDFARPKLNKISYKNINKFQFSTLQYLRAHRCNGKPPDRLTNKHTKRIECIKKKLLTL